MKAKGRPRSILPLSPIELRKIAVNDLDGMDERTLRKVLLGRRVLPTTRERVRRVFAEKGLEHLIPEQVV